MLGVTCCRVREPEHGEINAFSTDGEFGEDFAYSRKINGFFFQSEKGGKGLSRQRLAPALSTCDTSRGQQVVPRGSGIRVLLGEELQVGLERWISWEARDGIIALACDSGSHLRLRRRRVT